MTPNLLPQSNAQEPTKHTSNKDINAKLEKEKEKKRRKKHLKHAKSWRKAIEIKIGRLFLYELVWRLKRWISIFIISVRLWLYFQQTIGYRLLVSFKFDDFLYLLELFSKNICIPNGESTWQCRYTRVAHLAHDALHSINSILTMPPFD